MRLLFIRHAEPDYAHDCLTAKGLREAQIVGERITKYEDFDECFVSPMGRARQTAEPFLRSLDRKATVLPWLQEFEHPIITSDGYESNIPWDLEPHEWILEPEHFDKDLCYTTPLCETGHLEKYAREVRENFDALLADNGYERLETKNNAPVYKAVHPNHRTLLFVCHFGVMNVILGHILGFSPLQLCHALSAPTSSMTQVFTEEIEDGYATFRMNYYGDTSHLHAAGEPLSFNPRLTECAGDPPRRTYQGKAL